jgi:hypothetical protein
MGQLVEAVVVGVVESTSGLIGDSGRPKAAKRAVQSRKWMRNLSLATIMVTAS